MRHARTRSALAAAVVGAIFAIPATADAVVNRTFTNSSDFVLGANPNEGFRFVAVNVPANERVIDVDAVVRARHTQANDVDVSLTAPNAPGGAQSAEQRSIMLMSDWGSNLADLGPSNGTVFATFEFDQAAAASASCTTTVDITVSPVRPTNCSGSDGVNDSFSNGFVPQQTSLDFYGTPANQSVPRNGNWQFRLRDDLATDAGRVDFVQLQVRSTVPVADITAAPNPAVVGQVVTVTDGNSAADAGVPGAVITNREYDLDGNGTFEFDPPGAGPDSTTTSFATAGPRTLRIRVTQTGGATQTDSIVVNVVAPEDSAQCTAGGTLFNGTAAADARTGGAGQDRMFGLGGEDQLNGAGGNDCVDGGSGADVLDGGSGNDILIGGGPEGDKISDTAGSDSDLVFPGDGDDAVTVADGDGNDFVDCGVGNDIADVDPGDRTANCEQLI